LNTGSTTVYTAPETRSAGTDGRPETTTQITPFTTSKVQVPLKEHKLASTFTEILNEQSIIDVASFLDQDAMETMAESLESVIINGDTTTTSSNINTDTTPGTGIQTPDYIAWNGLRHNPLVDNTDYRNAKGSAVDVLDYERTMKLFPVAIRTRRKNMLFIIDESVESQTRRFPEYLTQDVAGQQATAFIGDLPAPFGIELYMSAFMGLTKADGTISDTTTNNTKGSILCPYAPYWQYGRQRQVRVDTVYDPWSGSTTVIVSVVHVLTGRGAAAATLTYNLTV
jgi:hypothetical protein